MLRVGHKQSRRWQNYWLFSVIAAFLLCGSYLQATTNAFPHYNVRVWQIDDGLPQNSVWAITQTKDGYVWVGTQQGLARFDGMRFVSLDNPAAPELRHGYITALCTGKDGSLWIGCSGSGLYRMRDGQFSHFSEADGLPTNHLNCILEANDGTLWMGTDCGVTHFQGGKFTSFTDKHGLAAVKSLFEDRNGTIRAATSRGLSSITKEGSVSTLNFKLGTTFNILKSACEDREGNIWVACNEGVTCERDQKRTFYGLNEGLPDKITSVVFEDRHGRIWAGTYNGLARLADGKVVSTPLNEAGFGDRVYTIFEDREENLWLGAQDGLYRVRPARFRTYTTQDGLTFNHVMSVYEDPSETLWIGTWGGGVNQLKGDTIVPFVDKGMPHDKILALHLGQDNNFWIGADHGGGVNQFKLGAGTRATRLNGLIDAAPRVVYEDHAKSLWIGTKRGLNIYRKGQVATYTVSDGLAGNDVWAILEDTSGNVWVGTDCGLMRWNEGKFVTFTTRDVILMEFSVSYTYHGFVSVDNSTVVHLTYSF